MTKQGYLFPVTDTAIESWKRVHGSKQTFWQVLLPLMLLMFAHTTALSHLLHHPGWLLATCIPLFLIILLLGAGLIHMGIYVAKNQPISFNTMMYAFHPLIILHLFGLFILQSIIIGIPSALIGLGIYLMTLGSTLQVVGIILTMAATISVVIFIIRIMFSVAFVLDHDENPFIAIRKSIAITSDNGWNLVGFIYMSLVILVASMLTALLGFIWTIPFWYIWYGMIYTTLSKHKLSF